MITEHELVRRLHITERSIDHCPPRTFTGHDADRVTAAIEDIRRVRTGNLLRRALTHLSDHQAGHPASSMPLPSGQGGLPSDRTGETAVAPVADQDEPARPDVVASSTEELDTTSKELMATALKLLGGHPVTPLTKYLERDASIIRGLVMRWAREPDVRWCRWCWKTNAYRSPVYDSRYADLCRRCGDWRAVNGELPQAEIIRYLQIGKTPPRTLLEKYRAKLPRTKKARA